MAEQKKVAVVLDDWKLPVFEQRLREAGYDYQRGEEFTRGSTTLTCMIEATQEAFDAIHMVLRLCEAQCRRRKRELMRQWREEHGNG